MNDLMREAWEKSDWPLTKGGKMKVEELSQYGKTLTGIPKEAMKKQQSIVLHELRRKYGLVGILPFFVRVLLEKRSLIKKYPEAYQEVLKFGEVTAKELPLLISMFNVVSRKEGKGNAYEFVKSIFQKVAVYSLPALYQIDELVECEGDVFKNFAKFNMAWFNAMNEEGTWKVKEMKHEKDHLTIVVDYCSGCEISKAFHCPDVAKLGCDHDLAGYPVFIDRVDAEFRRPHTIAKGDEYCDFMFYRKGTAPDTEHLNK
jgi:hypothetical protein